jgi:hypothetical protein
MTPESVPSLGRECPSRHAIVIIHDLELVCLQTNMRAGDLLDGEDTMKILVAAIALAVAAAAPAFAPGQQAQAQAYSKDQTTTKKVKKVRTQKRVVRSGSPYSTNPRHDVYVNGQYIGSDPDQRIRWTLKREYCSETHDGC